MVKKIALILLALMSLLAMGFTLDVTPTPQPGQASPVAFKTPEDAITYYLQAVAQGDFNKILQACAIDEIAQKFDFQASADRLKSFTPFQSMAPATGPMFTQINAVNRANLIASTAS
jgi:hypothetical protein